MLLLSPDAPRDSGSVSESGCQSVIMQLNFWSNYGLPTRFYALCARRTFAGQQLELSAGSCACTVFYEAGHKPSSGLVCESSYRSLIYEPHTRALAQPSAAQAPFSQSQRALPRVPAYARTAAGVDAPSREPFAIRTPALSMSKSPRTAERPRRTWAWERRPPQADYHARDREFNEKFPDVGGRVPLLGPRSLG